MFNELGLFLAGSIAGYLSRPYLLAAWAVVVWKWNSFRECYRNTKQD